MPKNTQIAPKRQKWPKNVNSKNYKNESRRAKNRYFNSLKSVWANPNIPARKKFAILQKLTNNTIYE